MLTPDRTLALPESGSAPTAARRALMRRQFGQPSALRCAMVAAFALLVLATLVLKPAVARAEGITIHSAKLEVRNDVDPGLFLDAQFDFDLPATLQDAVNRGVALYFVVDFELYQSRWYWFDRKLLTSALGYRLSYSPLTRQYRLARGSLAQPFESIGEALATIRSVRSWKLAERGLLQPGEDYTAMLRLRLDTSLLPKPFQVNALTNRDWTLSSEWRRVISPLDGLR